MAKAYCQCINPKGYRPLWNPELNQWSDVFICGSCQRPSKEVWRSYLGSCENCFKHFSFPETLYSPWGPLSVLADPPGTDHDGLYVCRRCAPLMGLQAPYRGWKWAARQCPDWHPGYVIEVSVAPPATLSEKTLDNLVALL